MICPPLCCYHNGSGGGGTTHKTFLLTKGYKKVTKQNLRQTAANTGLAQELFLKYGWWNFPVTVRLF
jgi:hypothetical protein